MGGGANTSGAESSQPTSNATPAEPATKALIGTLTTRVYGRQNSPARLGLVPTRDDMIEVLRQVEDPELGMDIVELGLLYDVEVEGPKVKVIYSLTSMGCPAGAMIEEQMREVVTSMEGVDEIATELTWTPPWSPEMMSDDAKFVLGF